MPEKDGNFDIGSVPVSRIHNNVSQVIITTTEDKMKIILNEYQDTQINSKYWATPLGIFITLITTLTTSTSNNFLLPKAYWESVYVTGVLIALFFLIRSGIKSWKAWRKPMSIEDVIDRIKNEKSDY